MKYLFLIAFALLLFTSCHKNGAIMPPKDYDSALAKLQEDYDNLKNKLRYNFEELEDLKAEKSDSLIQVLFQELNNLKDSLGEQNNHLSSLLSDFNNLKDEFEEYKESKDLATQQQNLQTLLTSSSDGWYVEYQPDKDSKTSLVWMKFNTDGTAVMQSDSLGFNVKQENIQYKVGGIIYPELIIKSNSLWQSFSNDTNSDFWFLMNPVDDDTIVLAAMRGSNHNPLKLIRANTGLKTKMEDHLEAIRLAIKDAFDNLSQRTYFKNFETDMFTWAWNINMTNKTIIFSWRENSTLNSETSAYSIIDGGILLNPAVQKDQIKIDTIFINNLTHSHIGFTRAGNVGGGSFFFTDTSIVKYPGATDYFYTNLPSRLQGNIQNDAADVSENLLPEFNYMADNIPGFKVAQFYIYPPSSSSSNYMAALYNPGSGNKWPAFFSYMSKTGEDSFKFSLKSKNTYGNTQSQYMEPFYNKLFTDKGVTIVPLDNRVNGRQQIRLVSREDSRNYVTLQLWFPSGYHYNP